MLEDYRRIASTLHLLLCSEQHATSMEEYGKERGKCSWYLETQLEIEECWQEPTHLAWTKRAKDLIDLSGTDGAIEELDGVLHKIIDISSKVSQLVRRKPQYRHLIKLCLDETIAQEVGSNAALPEPDA